MKPKHTEKRVLYKYQCTPSLEKKGKERKKKTTKELKVLGNCQYHERSEPLPVRRCGKCSVHVARVLGLCHEACKPGKALRSASLFFPFPFLDEVLAMDLKGIEKYMYV